MLTGDKRQAAMQIGATSSILENSMKIYQLTDDKDANVELKNFYKKAAQRARAKIGDIQPPPQQKPKRVSEAARRGMSINDEEDHEEHQAPLLTDTNP